MRAALLFAMPFVASASQAADEFGKMLLMARQDQSFVPTIGGSVTCLPPNSICGRYCKIVSKGDVCCPENCRSSLSKRSEQKAYDANMNESKMSALVTTVVRSVWQS